MIVIDLPILYSKTTKLSQLDDYKSLALQQAGECAEVTLTGRAPVWLYLAIAHELHGKARTLYYDSPASGKVLIFDHDPF